MLNKMKIMKKAWAYYREDTRFAVPKSAEGRRKLFARCLAAAWATAKQIAAKAMKTVAERAAEEVARIKRAIEELQYLPFAMQIESRRRALVNELSRVEATATA